MDSHALIFLQGFILGLSIAAPVGPIAILCIQRSLTQGQLIGFVSGLGAATADAAYGTVAALGITAVTHFLIQYQVGFRLVGGLFLGYLGSKIYLSSPPETVAVEENPTQLKNAYFSTFFLTLSNPMTIVSFAAIFAGFNVGMAGQASMTAVWFILGVFMGSATWWFMLSGSVRFFRHRLNPKGLTGINRVSGGIIIFLAVWMLSLALWQLLTDSTGVIDLG